MAVAIEQIQPGAVFRFKAANRRVVGLGGARGRGYDVQWEYADGKKRSGKLGGSQWVHYFRADAIEQILDPSVFEMNRKLLSGREVPSLVGTVRISIDTHCPAKWAFVDMQTGQMWGHDGSQFKPLTDGEIAEVNVAVKQAS